MTNKQLLIFIGIAALLYSAALPAKSLSQAADQQFIYIGIHGYQGSSLNNSR
jgi:hypothetical protein